MNDKIDALLEQLKTEIANYVEAEVASRNQNLPDASDPETSVDAYVAPTGISAPPAENAPQEVSTTPTPGFSAPPAEVSLDTGSFGDTPDGGEAIQAPPVTVDVPPMPEPTQVDVNPVPDLGQPQIEPGQETRSFSEASTFGAVEVPREGNPVMPDSGLPIPAPDFTLPEQPATPISQDTSVPAVDMAAFAENPAATPISTVSETPAIDSEFKMPGVVNNPATPDAFNGPVSDLPEPSASSTASPDVPLADALADLPPLTPPAFNSTGINDVDKVQTTPNVAPDQASPQLPSLADIEASLADKLDATADLPAPTNTGENDLPAPTEIGTSDLPAPDFSLPADLPLPPTEATLPSSPDPVAPALVDFTTPIPEISPENNSNADSTIAAPNTSGASTTEAPLADTSSILAADALAPPSAPETAASSADGSVSSDTTPTTGAQALEVNSDTASAISTDASSTASAAETSGFGKAKGLLNRVLKKEWGKQ